jgi:oligopeptide/dipeptide ABC transporter ATP-binding protein
MSVDIRILRGVVPAVRGIDLEVRRGEIIGIVGESGCGKSTAMNAVARLLPDYAKITADMINLDGVDLSAPSKDILLSVRGSRIAYIFQDPQASLNPVMKIGDQIIEAILVKNKNLKIEKAREKARNLLNNVKISNPDIWLDSYPHHLSGGMKQRVMIAMALANSPSVLVADEPTTSLDVTVQSEILNLLKELNAKEGMTIVFITHDLSVAKKLCNRIAVMYAGKIVEVGDAEKISKIPRHPYTADLWTSIPRIDVDIEELNVIPGSVPNPIQLPPGCKFHPRCKYVKEKCRQKEPKFDDNILCFYPLDKSIE